MAYLTARQDTVIKTKPVQASSLPVIECIRVPRGKRIAVTTCQCDVGGHLYIKLGGKLTVAGKVWQEAYVFGLHWEGHTAIAQEVTRKSLPGSPPGDSVVRSPAPYFCQNDNHDWQDDGSRSNLRHGGVQCGLTSAAMVAASFLGDDRVSQLAAQGKGGRFDNWVAGEFKRLGLSSTSAADHVQFFASIGLTAEFTQSLSVGQLADYLTTGKACVLGFAYRSSGHFCAGVGVDQRTGEILVNDPYGKRILSGSYNQWEAIAQTDADTVGQNNRYSPDALGAIWVDGGEASGWAVLVKGDPKTPVTQAPKVASGSGWATADRLRQLVFAIAHPDLDHAELMDLVGACASSFPQCPGLQTRPQVLHFFSQVGHESMGFYYLEEIASGADYEGRDDLGNIQPGDGRRFKGRGLIQLTGRDNYAKYFGWLGLPVDSDPATVATYPNALKSAIYFWERERLGDLCIDLSEDACRRVTKRVNGGYNGLADRLEKLSKLQSVK